MWDNTGKYTLPYVCFLRFKNLGVLPNATRMYPASDSAHTSLVDQKIEMIGQNLPVEMIASYKTLKNIGCA